MIASSLHCLLTIVIFIQREGMRVSELGTFYIPVNYALFKNISLNYLESLKLQIWFRRFVESTDKIDIICSMHLSCAAVVLFADQCVMCMCAVVQNEFRHIFASLMGR